MGDLARNAMSDSQLKTIGRKKSKPHPVNSPVMTVVQDLGFGRYELQQFREPDSAIVESSADLMRAEKSPSAADRKEAKLQAVRTLQNNTEYEVEAVTGERGVLTKGTKEYQVKWKNYSEKSWEPAESFDSKSKPLQEYKKRKKAQARHSSSSNHTHSRPVSMSSRITDSGYMCSGRNQGVRYTVRICRSAM